MVPWVTGPNARTYTTIAVLACVCLFFAAVSVQAAPRRRTLANDGSVPSWHPRSAAPQERSPTGVDAEETSFPVEVEFNQKAFEFNQKNQKDDEPAASSQVEASDADNESSSEPPAEVEKEEASDESSSGGGGSGGDVGTDLVLGPDMKKEKLDAAQQKASNAARKCDLIFASFFATKPGGFSRKKGERCNGCHEAPMFITFDSARITNPGACTAVITDTDTQVDVSKPGMDQVMVHRFKGLDRSKIGGGGLMVERMKLYNAFIKRARDQGWTAKLIMVDTDIVVVGSVAELFDQAPDFDYGVSVRNLGTYPVQGGVQYVNTGRYEGAARFSDYVLRKWLQTLDGKEGGFTGDQRAYQEAIAPVKAIVAVAAKGKTHVMAVVP
eukprot:CAMPEP_0197583136 /NCGR_PEP_ID=MMETSP1326-20131121/6148_1 /TAXON_ID=1155430 /ORGANISM="Genus nov. species nov., Strain RCC2288" /LENGTH=382 /DNA_ID=CAMNT_0043147311 /DNA_START=53 /DNA_END=1197 /DNA_ORIENTATION=+